MPTAKQIFISYARSDGDKFAKRLYESLKKLGFEDWWDQKTMESRGITFMQEIRDAITEVERLLLILSPETEGSEYVKWEWEYALSICKTVVPLIIDGHDRLIPSRLKKYHYIDFRGNRSYENVFADLANVLATPVVPLGKLVGVPRFPPHYLDRLEELEILKKRILTGAKKPIVMTGTGRHIGIQGMAGIGKTVLAASVSRDGEILRAFFDGVFWIRLGQEPDLTIRQGQLADALGSKSWFFRDTQGIRVTYIPISKSGMTEVRMKSFMAV